MGTHKKGDSWSYIGTAGIKNASGQLMDLTGWQIASQARNAKTGAVVATFSCAWVDPVQQTYTHQALHTTTWPVGDLVLDVQFTSPSGFVVSTPTVDVQIVKDVTA